MSWQATAIHRIHRGYYYISNLPIWVSEIILMAPSWSVSGYSAKNRQILRPKGSFWCGNLEVPVGVQRKKGRFDRPVWKGVSRERINITQPLGDPLDQQPSKKMCCSNDWRGKPSEFRSAFMVCSPPQLGPMGIPAVKKTGSLLWKAHHFNYANDHLLYL